MNDRLRFRPEQIRFLWLMWFLVGWTALTMFVLVVDVAPYTVRGHSMEPTLHDGDTVITFRNIEPAIGRVAVLGKRGGGLMVHRIIDVTEDGRVLTQGDANMVDDGWNGSANPVEGVVRWRLPFGTGWLTLIVFVSILVWATVVTVITVRFSEMILVRMHAHRIITEPSADPLSDESIAAAIDEWSKQ